MLLPSFIVSAVTFPTSPRRHHVDDAEKADSPDSLEPHNEQLDDMDDDHDEISPDEDYSSKPVLYSSVILPEPTGVFGKLKALLHPKDTNKDIEEYVPNYRHTPILSGIIVPLAILLEIPGLTQHWYVRTQGDDIVETQPNPLILNIGLGFSMACALAANIALIIRFLEKRVRLMTFACIIFLTIHDIINVIAVITFGVGHRFDDGFTYGQSFWVTVCSTAVSTITNISLITDFIRTPSFDSSGSGLTRKQRSLVIIVIILFIYIAGGSLIHSIIEALSFIDALYYTVVTLETIGFGDITNKTTGGRVFTCTYAVIGIIILGLAISLIRETVLEALEVSYRKRLREIRARRRASAWRRRVTRRWREAIEWRLRASRLPVWVKDDPLQNDTWIKILDKFPWNWFHSNRDHEWGEHRYLGATRHPHGMHLNLEALSGEQLEAAAMEAGVPLSTLLPPSFWRRKEKERDKSSRAGTPLRPLGPAPGSESLGPSAMPLTYSRLGRMSAILTSFALSVNHSVLPQGASDPGGPAFSGLTGMSGTTAASAFTNWNGASEDPPRLRKSLTQQYDEFTKTMDKEERKAFVARLIVAWTLFFTFWMSGSVIFMHTEGWSFGIAMYFCFVAFSTIGYGDYTPKSPAGRSIFVVWALLGVGTMTILVSILSEAYSSQYKRAIHSGMVHRAVKRYRKRASSYGADLRQRKEGRPPIPSRKYTASSTASITADTESQIQEDRNEQVHLHGHQILDHSHEKVRHHLESLPHQVLDHVKAFQEHMQFFVGGPGAPRSPRGASDMLDAMPDGIKMLLDDIAGAEKLGDRVKKELLQDPYARHTLFTLSIERGLRAMIDSAEEAIDALEERDYLTALHEHEKKSKSSPDSVDEDDVRSQAAQSHTQSHRLGSRSLDSVHFME